MLNTLTVFVCRLSFTQTEADFEKLQSVLSDERRQHILTFAQKKDRLRSLFAELLLRFALMHDADFCRPDSDDERDSKEGRFDKSHALETNPTGNCQFVTEETLLQTALTSVMPPLTFSYGPHGKPVMNMTAAQQADTDSDSGLSVGQAFSETDSARAANHVMHFNLSHSGDFVACVVSSHECGVDIQEIRPVRDSLFKKNLSEEEQADLLQFEGEAREKRCFEYWVLKEAYIKARGDGLSFPLKKATFEISEDGLVYMRSEMSEMTNHNDSVNQSKETFSLRHTFDNAGYICTLYDVAPGYACAAGCFISEGDSLS